MPQNLDPRLSLLYRMTPPCDRAADIGTDHGYLICALVESGRARRGIAADIHEKPLEKARQEAARRGLSGRMDFVLGDGLDGISPEGLEVVIIAGMGGETIAHILEGWPHAKAPGITWLLQPMTKAERLRDWLWGQGFSISREKCCTAAGRVYSVMEARYAGEAVPHEEWERYLGAVRPGEGPDELRYARGKADKLLHIAAGLERTGEPGALSKAARLRAVSREIQGVIEREAVHF